MLIAVYKLSVLLPSHCYFLSLFFIRLTYFSISTFSLYTRVRNAILAL
jgi:hypothetical protein